MPILIDGSADLRHHPRHRSRGFVAASARSSEDGTTRAIASCAPGLPVPAAVVLIYTIGICLGMVAFVVSRIDRTSAYVLTAAVSILAVLSGVLLSLVPPDDEAGGEPTALRARPYAHPMAKSRRTSHRPARPSSTHQVAHFRQRPGRALPRDDRHRPSARGEHKALRP